MERVDYPIAKDLILSELTEDKFIRYTNHKDNKIYIVDAHNSPNTMQEIGRLRELTFRRAGGGTGKAVDIDDFDTAKVPYKQLIVFDQHKNEIIGGYRFIICRDAEKDENGIPKIATAKLFDISTKFKEKYLPYTIELGRSFIQPKYQATSSKLFRKGMYALDNLWDGLGTLIVDHPDMKYLFGKITMYPSFNKSARDMIIYFLQKYFNDSENLLTPLKPIEIETNAEHLESIFFNNTYRDDYKILLRDIKKFGERIPPLFNAYMNLSPSMKVFGATINDGFGNVEETGIMLTIGDIYKTKLERHINSYKSKIIKIIKNKIIHNKKH